jgi:hypothetical protein
VAGPGAPAPLAVGATDADPDAAAPLPLGPTDADPGAAAPLPLGATEADADFRGFAFRASIPARLLLTGPGVALVAAGCGAVTGVRAEPARQVPTGRPSRVEYVQATAPAAMTVPASARAALAPTRMLTARRTFTPPLEPHRRHQ